MTHILVLYASQEGNATEIAKRIHQQAQLAGYDSTLGCLNDFKKIGLENWPTMEVAKTLTVIVTSSTGQGDPPDNPGSGATRFWRWLKQQKDSVLQGVLFTLLGLGDTNYDTYQGFPRSLYEQMVHLGATDFYRRGEADDATGLEDVVEPWINDLWPAIKKAFTSVTSSVQTSKTSETPSTSPTSASTPSEKSPSSPDQKVPKFVRKVNIKPGGAATSNSDGKSISPVPLPPSVSEVVWMDTVPEIPPTAHITKDFKLAFTGNSTKEHPFYAKVSSVKRLTTSQALKEVLHFEIDFDGAFSPSQLQDLKPGDSFGIVPPNPSYIVDKILNHLKCDGNKVFTFKPKDPTKADQLPSHIKTPTTIRNALTYYCNLTDLPKRGLLRLLGEYAQNPTEKEELLLLATMSPQGKALYQSHIELGLPSLADLLEHYPSSQPPISHLFDVLSPIPSRYYSISNSLALYPKKIHFAFTVVRNEKAFAKSKATQPTNTTATTTTGTISPYSEPFYGICTNWLKSLAIQSKLLDPLNPDETNDVTKFGYFINDFSQLSISETSLYIPIFLHKSNATPFHLPVESTTPIIMVGPGTGVAPFRSFLQERQVLKSSNRPLGISWLFYGCRHPDLDYLYREDLQGAVSQGVLTKLCEAYSCKTPNDTVYVQHLLKENAREILDLMIEKNAYFFICGDAIGMAPSVRSAILEVLKTEKKFNEEEAQQVMKSWVEQKRYLLDIWG